MDRNAPFGYEWKDRKLTVNEKESSIVKWIVRMLLEYDDNPPDFLIQKVIDSSDKELSFEEAKEKVSFSMVQRYVVAELKMRMQQYDHMQGTPEKIQHFLDIPLNQKLLAAVERNYDSYREVEYGINPFLENEPRVYVGKIKPLSESAPGFKRCNSEPIILKELYESAVEKVKEYREQRNCSQQTDTETMRGQSM